MVDVTTDQSFPDVALAITNSRGDPALVDGVPVWASSDETVLSVTSSADGMSGSVDTVGPGVARVSVTVDADLGAGTKTLTGVSEDVNVTPGAAFQASNFVFTFGPPVDKT